MLAPLSQGASAAARSRASRGERQAEATRVATEMEGQDLGEEQEVAPQSAIGAYGTAQAADTLVSLFQWLLRVSQAQSCAAKAPDKFVDTPKANISAWLEVAETYLQAKQVPRAEWPATILTFLAEGPLVKAKRARLQETANSYDEFRKNLISILGRPKDKEQARVSLDSARQQPSEAVADFASRILESVSRAWGEMAPDAQISIATHHFCSGLFDSQTRDALRQQRALFDLA